MGEERTIAEMIGGDISPAAALWGWRKSTLFDVASMLSDPKVPEQQKQIGIWPYGERIPYPEMSAFNIIGNGCLTFNVTLGEHEVMFSVWMLVGEVRIGVKMPSSIVLNNAQLKARISKCLDGRECQRIEHGPTSVFFDWIWSNEGWTGFDFMLNSIVEPINASVLADHIAQMLLALYLSVIHILIDGNATTVRLRTATTSGMARFAVTETGDDEAFREVADRLGWVIEKTTTHGSGERMRQVLAPVGSPPMSGRIRTDDGAEAYVTGVARMPQ